MENMYELINKRTCKVLENIDEFKGKDTDVDAVKLAKFFGFEIFLLKNMHPSNIAGLTVSNSSSQKDIYVNDFYNRGAERVAITECLSTYLLYYGDEESFSCTIWSKPNSKNEYVSYFARNILMPMDSFSRMYELLSDNMEYFSVIRALEAICDVPRDVVVKRIEDMTLLKDKEKTK